MKVEASTVTKLLISELERVDPVTVFLEDLGHSTYKRDDDSQHISRQGKITIECYGESWSAYWGGMGDRLVAQFFTDCGVDYLSGCLMRGTSLRDTIFCGDKLEDEVKKTIIECRRRRGSYQMVECGSLDKEDARRLWGEADGFLTGFSSPEGLMHSSQANSLLNDLYGDEWHYDVERRCFKPNPQYQYLCRIIEAVQEALRSLAPDGSAL